MDLIRAGGPRRMRLRYQGMADDSPSQSNHPLLAGDQMQTQAQAHAQVQEPVLTLQEAMRADLEAIGATRMPFGKYGPTSFPPQGLPIYDLPAEYLAWFANKAGWPKGRLGQLLQMVYQMKADGSDAVFDPFRRKAGGRSKLRPERQRDFTFPEAHCDETAVPKHKH